MKKSLKNLCLVAIFGLGFSYAAHADEVSTMNGELVEVGERHRYEYKAPKFNISTNPFSILGGLYNVSASYGVSKIVAVKGDVSYDDDKGHTSAEVNALIFFKKRYSGLYLEPGVLRRTSDNVFGPQVLMGYQWIWDSGMNISLAGGLGRNLNYDKSSDNSREGFGNGYFRVGYAF